MPEIDVNGNGITIVSGAAAPALSIANNTNFGTVTADGASSILRIFTIENIGDGVLHLSGTPKIQVSGYTDGFSITDQPPETVSAGSSVTFQVMFRPPLGVLGQLIATISIPSNDPSEGIYTFMVTARSEEPNATAFYDNSSTYDLGGGWKWNAMYGYLYSRFHPYAFVFSAKGRWLYLVGNRESEGYYFYDFDNGDWCYTFPNGDYYYNFKLAQLMTNL
ncbi:MAG: choice-of-anchor D domain-containing protein [Verrucomicrobiota bacterium]|nr:choice-of-anchor D domain-containing protein [Verrucomicrobiota bacterium]